MSEGEDWASEAGWYVGASKHPLVEMGTHFRGFCDTSAKVNERA